MATQHINSKGESFEPGIAQVFAEIRHLIDDLAISEFVLKYLIPNGKPYAFESTLWDYKESLPQLPERSTEVEKKNYKASIGDIIKDVVAFHNAYGGYIVFGIKNSGDNRIVGCENEFDCGQLNVRIQSYTMTNIECIFAKLTYLEGDLNKQIGLLLVPRRASNAPPVSFTKDGPEKQNGGRSFNKGTYIRVRDECRPATATSDDWLFLHSDRNPPEIQKLQLKRQVHSALPARDPDLIEFVGREESLAKLRDWLTDLRSPIRLVTGIGGLGKTTLVYRFAEEVVETGAGGIEWVIWLTAKQQTYSALRGKLVPTNKVDFNDLNELLSAILKTLSYELPFDEERPTVDELSERVIDALCHYSCLIVVDDIDSLNPDQQRETVATLSGIAQRMVGRDVAPTRILMTSRIDQGLPTTAVIKIPGLDKNSFEKHLRNLTNMFKIPEISGALLDAFYDTTFGSPLFSSSIVRLVHLGENLKDCVSTWKNQEGEEVRRFAFEREIKRLTTSQSRLLYAVLLLGETSIIDLANILDLAKSVIRDRISDLQAYHLIATSTNQNGDTIIYAPKELTITIDILRLHIGPQAQTVETACAHAEERSKVDLRSVGVGIRQILSAWELHRYNEAIIIAEDLRRRFPKNGDVASILGACFLRASPPRLSEADRELDIAYRLSCNRPELISNIIKVKTDMQDWIGLHDFTKPLNSKETSRDAILSAYITSCVRLVRIAIERVDYVRVAELSIEAVEKIGTKIEKHRLDPAFFSRIASDRFDFSKQYVQALDRLHPRAGDRIHVFEGVARLADVNVVLTELLKFGLNALLTWWTSVEGRPVVDEVACAILGKQLRRLEKIERQLKSYGSASIEVLDEIAIVSRDLSHRGSKFIT